MKDKLFPPAKILLKPENSPGEEGDNPTLAISTEMRLFSTFFLANQRKSLPCPMEENAVYYSRSIVYRLFVLYDQC